MAAQTDWVLENRRLRGRSRLWRVLAIVLAAIAVAALAWRGVAGAGGDKRAAHVARVHLTGFIAPSEARHKMLHKLADDAAVKAVVLVINSPGGGVTASEEIYDDLRAIAKKKPVVAVMGSLAASGGYLAALGADHIVARYTSLTGSIGVLVQYPNFSELLGKVGVSMEAVKSAPLKAEPNGFTPTPPAATAALKQVVMDSFGWFKNLVGTRRAISGAALDQVSDGRIFTGHQALGLHLIDQIGGEDAARGWLAGKGVPEDLPMVDWTVAKGFWGNFSLGRAAAADVLDALGLSRLGAGLRQAGSAMGELQALDGLLAVWHP
jgi:protease-4